MLFIEVLKRFISSHFLLNSFFPFLRISIKIWVEFFYSIIILEISTPVIFVLCFISSTPTVFPVFLLINRSCIKILQGISFSRSER